MTTGDEIIASSIFRAASSLHHQSVHPRVTMNKLLAAGENKTCRVIKPRTIHFNSNVLRRTQLSCEGGGEKVFTNQQP
jgi:hypothetical protein